MTNQPAYPTDDQAGISELTLVTTMIAQTAFANFDWENFTVIEYDQLVTASKQIAIEIIEQTSYVD